MNVLKELFNGKKIRATGMSGYVYLRKKDSSLRLVYANGMEEAARGILNLNSKWIEYIPEPPKELTVEEIEAELGYKIKIVGGKD